MNREKELQSLLAEERERSEQRRLNYTRLKEEHIKLQKDFLTLTGELKNILHEDKLKEERLTLQIDHVTKLVSEKDRLIQDLREEVASRDPSKIREKLSFELKEPLRRLQLEKEQVTRECEKLTYDLKVSHLKVTQLEKEITDAIERTKLTFVAEINCLKREKEELKVTIAELSKLPDNQKLSTLMEENCRLKSKLTQNKVSLEESQINYNKICNRFDLLISQIETRDVENETLLSTLKNEVNSAREQIQVKEATIRSQNRRLDELTDSFDRVKRQLTETQEELTLVKSKYQSDLDMIRGEKETLRTQVTQLTEQSNEYLKMRDRYRIEYEKLKECLDEERKDLVTFKTTSEGNLKRLRQCIQDERKMFTDKITSLTATVDQLKSENVKLKARCKQLIDTREKLSNKFKLIEKNLSLVTAVTETAGKGEREKCITRCTSQPDVKNHQDTRLDTNGSRVTFSPAFEMPRNSTEKTTDGNNGSVRDKNFCVKGGKANDCCDHCRERHHIHDEKVTSHPLGANVPHKTPIKQPASVKTRVTSATGKQDGSSHQVSPEKRKTRQLTPSKCEQNKCKSRTNVNTICNRVTTGGGTSYMLMSEPIHHDREEEKKKKISLECHENLKKQYNDLRRTQEQLSGLLNLTLTQSKM